MIEEKFKIKYLKSNLLKFDITDLMVACLGLIFCLTSINALYHSIAYSFGSNVGTYIYRGDLLADFYKVVFSYPTGNNLGISNYANIPDALKEYVFNNPYNGISGFASGSLTHFHLPPLTTSINLLFIKIASLIGLIKTFLPTALISIFIIALPTFLVSKNKQQLILLLATVFISYPLLFAIQRGNLYALYSNIFLICSILLLKRGRVTISILLFSIAVNIRPNLLIFLPLFYFWPGRNIVRALIAIIVTGLLFIVSFDYTNSVYSQYTFENFLAGLAIYNELYVHGDNGLAYSSSLYTLIKFFFKFTGWPIVSTVLNISITITSFLFVLYISVLYARKNICDLVYAFLLVAICMIGTPVFADYHLIIFVLPMFLIIDKANKAVESTALAMCDFIIYISCSLMLSPFNYFQFYGGYIASFLKTIIVIYVCITLLKLKNNPCIAR